MTTCACGSDSSSSSSSSPSPDAYITLERLLLKLGWGVPDEIKTSCTRCLNSMISDVTGELTAIQEREINKSNSLFKILDDDHPDYKMVVERFQETVDEKVIRIEQVCNTDLEQEFQGQICGKGTLQWLFHGSQNENYVSIAQNGFDIERSKDGLLGRGVYFAQNASYSNGFTHYVMEKEDSKHIANMFLCKVYILAEDIKGQDIYCIHNDRRAYPKYLVYYQLEN